ncbi:MAG: hypothetical protein L3J39_16650 [Verrucomicrobiales bacterium]|nr:hypothetical protein [Verrucomicrobiales bacterium]
MDRAFNSREQAVEAVTYTYGGKREHAGLRGVDEELRPCCNGDFCRLSSFFMAVSLVSFIIVEVDGGFNCNYDLKDLKLAFYVVQNPWSKFDPLGLDAKNVQTIDDAFSPQNLSLPLRIFAKITFMEFFIKRGLKAQDKALDKAETETGVRSDPVATAKNALVTLAPDIAINKAVGVAVGVISNLGGDDGSSGESKPGGETSEGISKKSEEDVKYHYTDDKTAEKIEKEGLWSESHATDEGGLTSEEAVDRTGTTKPPTRVVPIKDKGRFKPTTPARVPEHKNGDGGASNFYNPERISPEDILPSRPLPDSSD